MGFHAEKSQQYCVNEPLRHVCAGLIILAMLLVSAARATSQTAVVGLQPFGSYQGNFDKINLADLGLHIDIPLYVHKARGASNGVSAHLIYDTSYSSPTDSGWRVIAAAAGGGGNVQASELDQQCPPPDANLTYQQWTYYFVDGSGYRHSFSGTSNYNINNCKKISNTTLNVYASDGTGYLLSGSGQSATVTDRSGTKNIFTVSQGNWQVVDSNGNTGYPQSLQDTSNVSIQVTGGAYIYQNGVPTSRNPTLIKYTDSNGSPQQIEVDYTLIGSSGNVTSLTFPDSSSYNVTYQPTTTITQGACFTLQYGMSVGLPTSGTISYNSTIQQCSNTCPTTTLVRATSDGSTTYQRSAASYPSCISPTTTTIAYQDGSSEIVHNVPVSSGNYGNVETSHSWKNSSGVLMKSTMRCYNGATGDCTSTAVSFPITQIATTTTPAGVPSAKTVEFLNAYGLQSELDEYDYGAVSPTRKTLTTYASLGNNIVDRPLTVKVEDGSSSIFSQSTYSYDDYSPLPPSGVTGLATVSGSRGNLTSVQQSVSASVPPITTHTHYDDAGQVVSTTDGKTYVTSYTHDSTDTYVTQKTYPPVAAGAFSEYFTPDPNTGLVTQSKDLNGKITGYTYDSMLRNVGICYPDGGYTKSAYTTTSLTVSRLTDTGTGCFLGGGIPSGSWLTTTNQYDGYGRIIHSTDAAGNTVDTQYDLMGGVFSVSNPHSLSGSSTDGTVFYQYDALGEKTKQTNQDGTFLFWCYNGIATMSQPNCKPHIGAKPGQWVDSQDETLNQRQQTTDALGRLIYAIEPNGTNQIASMETDYSYDVLNNLTTVKQWGGPSGSSGAEIRSFSYDNVSRLIQAYNPETGWVCYGTTTGGAPNGSNCNNNNGYDPNANLVYKTDARNIVINYAHDALNRLTGKTYTVPNPAPLGYAATSPVTYTYDQGSASANPIGRRTSMTDATGGEAWAYDSMGRITYINRSILTPQSNQGAPAWFNYNLDGSLNSGSFYTSTSYQYTYDSAGRATGVTYNNNGSLSPIASGATYDTTGHLVGLVQGTVTTSNSYNNRLQPLVLSASQNTSNLIFKHTFCYSSCYNGAPSGNNGNIQTDLDGTPVANNATYTYDTLNRLLSGQGPSWGDSYTYDPFGNLSQMTPIGNGSGQALQAQSTPQNRLANIGLVYDAAGNVIQDNLRTQYAYDAEGRLATAGSWTYSYDGDGKRVLKTAGGSTGETYWYGADGTLTDKQSVGLNPTYGWPGELVRNFYLNGHMVFTDGFPANTLAGDYSVLYDQIGSARVTVDINNGQILYTNYYPFGAYISQPTDILEERFTGKGRDIESGNDYFGARYYSSSIGRFMSPDWSVAPTPVPYADFEDPQSLNLYTYAGNNPLNDIDSDGHMHCDEDTFSQQGDAYVLTAGACHLEWSDFHQYMDSKYQSVIESALNARDLAAQAVHQVANIVNTPGGAPCLGGSVLAGGGVGAGAGAAIGSVGILTGPGVLVTETGAVTFGAAVGMGAGAGFGMSNCPGAGGGGSSGVSKGGRSPQDLTEQLAAEEAASNPQKGIVVPLKKGMTDKNWPGSAGWVKMAQNIKTSKGNIEVHYVYNTITKVVDDVKIK